MIQLLNPIVDPGPDAAVHVRIGHVPVSLESDMPEARQDFESLYAGQFQLPAYPDHTIRMEVRRCRRSLLGGRRYFIRGDGERMGKPRRPEEVLPYLEWAINWRLIARRTEFLQLHAATVTHAGRGAIFAGTSGQGKTTLAAGLLARGWQYLSDEFALIDPDTLHLHPFPKPLCIKSGSFDVVRQLGLPLWQRRHYVKAQKGAVAYVPPRDIRPDIISRHAPARLVIFPAYVEDQPPRLRPISRAEAALALAKCSFNRNVYGPRALTILSDLVRNARCFNMTTGPIDQTCDLIESALAAETP